VIRPLVPALLTLLLSMSAVPAAAETTVSLSFDDGTADQLAGEQILTQHGLHGTFFIIPPRIGEPGYMTWSQVASVYADGDEIGGHTLTHPDLTTLSADQQRSEICGARQDLLARGYPQVSFAYPFGHYDPSSEGVVAECGYASGRASGGLADSPAESIPPLNRWAIRTRNSVTGADTVDALERSVFDAEAVGDGWLNIVFHAFCDPSSDPACPRFHMTPSDFDAFLDWLQPRDLIGTRVKTIGEVMIANPEPLFSLTGLRKRRNGTAKLSLYAGRPGLLQVVQASAPGATAIPARHKAMIRPVSMQVTHAGVVAVTLRASSVGERILRRKGRLKSLVTATFTAFRGTSISQTVKVKLRPRERR
jgi:peptidoglycan/xylan/chitin deacetylase (PgdA/CDA1 family)